MRKAEVALYRFSELNQQARRNAIQFWVDAGRAPDVFSAVTTLKAVLIDDPAEIYLENGYPLPSEVRDR